MTSRDEPLRIVRQDRIDANTRPVAVEAPIAFEVDGIGYAVMMATPADLATFATGFALTERLADTIDDIIDVDPFEAEAGWIVRVALHDRCKGRIHDRVRHRTSDTACGLCGIAGLEQVQRPVATSAPRPVAGRDAIFAALADLRSHQPLNAATGAVHAATACDPGGAIVAAFEDVGRHNALDKLIGWLAIERRPIDGFLLVTSRLSFEMVDKALVARAPMLVGISAPTTMAIDHARTHGLTLVALARPDAVLAVVDPYGKFASGSEGGT